MMVRKHNAIKSQIDYLAVPSPVVRRPKRNRSWTVGPVLIAAVLTAAACGSSRSTATSPPTTASATGSSPSATTPAQNFGNLTVQIYPGNVNAWLDLIAIDQGFFKKNGIDATTAAPGTGAQAVAALASGAVDLLTSSVTLTAPALAKGLKFQIVSGETRLFWAVTVPGTSSVPDTFPADMKALVGKSVQVPAIGADAYFLFRAALQAAGLPPDSVKYVPTNSPNPLVQVAIMERGSAYADIGNDPIITYLLQKGFKIVLDMRKPIPNAGLLSTVAGQPYVNLWMTTSFIHSHPAEVKAIQLSLEEADCWAHDPAHLSALYTQMTSGGDAAKYGLPTGFSESQGEAYIKSNLPESYYSSANAQAWMKFAVQYGIIKTPIPVSQILDPTTPASPAAVYRAVTAAGGSCSAYAGQS